MTRAQLLDAGLSEGAVRSRIRRGQLDPIYVGVYATGPLLHAKARYHAAVLACGEDAVLSHESAGALWGLHEAQDGPVDVTLPAGCGRSRTGIRVHRTALLPAEEVAAVEGIPLTGPARTLLDLAGRVGRYELERALARAIRSHLTDLDTVRALIGRYRWRRGIRQLRALLAAGDPALTRSEAERRLLDLLRRARLPRPHVNASVAGLEVDFLWRRYAIVVEVEGFAFHRSRASFERDRKRHAALTARGLRVLRLTWRQITEERERTLVLLARALAAGGWHPSATA